MVVTPFGPIATQSGPRGESSRSYPTVASPSFLARASSRSRLAAVASSTATPRHRRFHFLQRLAHPSARRFLAALERQGDLRVGETLELAQHERRALPRWQGLDRQREIREGRVIPLRRRECQVIDVRDDPPHPPLAVDRAVRRDLVQPGPLVAPPRRRPRPERREERVLVQVLGIGPLAGDAQGVAQQLALLALDELAAGQRFVLHARRWNT